ncbi:MULTISPECIES: hypothetical protein [Streptomyces]|uniref:hypothetical protein n=1 Tax=Streptomyces TaxID=1883 RepID=UPI0033BBBE1C
MSETAKKTKISTLENHAGSPGDGSLDSHVGVVAGDETIKPLENHAGVVAEDIVQPAENHAGSEKA